jgi:hypothetical protein
VVAEDETLLFAALKPSVPSSLWTFSRASRKEEAFGESGDQPHHQVWLEDGRELFYNPRVSAMPAFRRTAM